MKRLISLLALTCCVAIGAQALVDSKLSKLLGKSAADFRNITRSLGSVTTQLGEQSLSGLREGRGALSRLLEGLNNQMALAEKVIRDSQRIRLSARYLSIEDYRLVMAFGVNAGVFESVNLSYPSIERPDIEMDQVAQIFERMAERINYAAAVFQKMLQERASADEVVSARTKLQSEVSNLSSLISLVERMAMGEDASGIGERQK